MSDAFDRLRDALADRYAIERELGAGGMAIVYLARDLKLKRNVALKVLRPELSAILGAERFLGEIEITANLQHPNILALHDSGEVEGMLYYVMPYVEGESLRAKLDREKQLSVEETVEITKAVAAALGYAHEHDVIHRDIKPENILLQSGQALVADFGIALAVSQAGGTRLTETGLSLGTPQYMSPEQSTGDRDLDARSDIYSLGCVAYEMLVGDPPHTGGNVQAIIAKTLSETPMRVSEIRRAVPTNVDGAIHRALEKTPADRFVTASDFVQSLTDSAFRWPSQLADSADASDARRKGRTIALAASGWVVTVVVLVLLLFLRTESPKPVVRYSMAFPDSQELNPYYTTPRVVLSPDGSRLAYIGQLQDNRVPLWIRSRDRLTATEVPLSSRNVNFPTFSPDGKQLAFVLFGESSTLMSTSVEGGGPITLLDSASAAGLSWGPDGFIYAGFQGQRPPDRKTVGLWRIPAGSGTSEAVSTLDTSKNEAFHWLPDVLPNGRGVLFSIHYGGTPRIEYSKNDIGVVELATGRHRVLLRGVAARYATSGHLVFVTAAGVVMGVPFDQDRMQITGEPKPLFEGVLVQGFGVVDLSLSRQGTLAYVTGEANLKELLWVARDGSRDTIDAEWLKDTRLFALSPDGATVVVSVVEKGEQHLWLKRLEGGPASRFTFEGTINEGPSWSQDGNSVLFASNRAGRGRLYGKPTDGTSEAVLLAESEFPITYGFASPDGEWLVWLTGNPDESVYGIRRGRDSVPTLLIDGPVRSPRLSPDGRWLAYVLNEQIGQPQVLVRPFPNTSAAVWLIEPELGQRPRWAHSGLELFYQTSDGLVAVEILTDRGFAVGRRQFLHRVATGPYEVMPGDQHFLMSPLFEHNRSELIIVENFLEELKARVGN